MKQLQTTEKIIGENTFYIKPFPAFTAANISGDLAAIITPLLGGLVPLLGNSNSNGETVDVMDTNVEDALPALTSAFSSLSGQKFEKLMKALLTDHRNVSVESEATNYQVQILSYDLANEVFCGEVQDMYILCWEVIKINYRGFFDKLTTQFGGLSGLMGRLTEDTSSTES